MTEPYRPGEVITVIERDVRVIGTQQQDYGLGIVVEQVMKGGARRACLIYADAPGTTVQRVIPADGTPKAGQVWADQLGEEWLAVLEGPHMGSGKVRLVAPNGSREDWLRVHADPALGPLRLVRDVPPPADAPEGDV
ncbi:hypothetical protein [Streptosporangium saharense]|uniref:hypothetical protein n=1 Tax=Streptosporangium saharense TaxID=1706840 RepID=UPI00343CFAC5